MEPTTRKEEEGAVEEEDSWVDLKEGEVKVVLPKWVRKKKELFVWSSFSYQISYLLLWSFTLLVTAELGSEQHYSSSSDNQTTYQRYFWTWRRQLFDRGSWYWSCQYSFLAEMTKGNLEWR